MQFRRTFANNPEGARSVVWTTDLTSRPFYEEKVGPFTALKIGGRKRRLDSRLLEVARMFTREAEVRQRLGQDCGAFALACQNGDSLEGRMFNQAGGHIVRAEYRGHPVVISESAHIWMGQIAALGRANSSDFSFSPAHLAVRADVDRDEEPLFLSKVGDSGGVILASLEAMATLYRADRVVPVQNLLAAMHE